MSKERLTELLEEVYILIGREVEKLQKISRESNARDNSLSVGITIDVMVAFAKCVERKIQEIENG